MMLLILIYERLIHVLRRHTCCAIDLLRLSPRHVISIAAMPPYIFFIFDIYAIDIFIMPFTIFIDAMIASPPPLFFSCCFHYIR